MNRPMPAWVLGLVVGALLASGLFMGSWFERKMLYFPERGLDMTPASAGLPFEDVHFQSSDGIALHGWFLPAKKEGVRTAVMLCHGNGGNIAGRVPFARAFLDHVDAHLFLFDYRGYGRSQGTPDEPGLYRDGLAALAALRDRSEVAPERVVVMGRSLGGGVATELSILDGKLAGVILESTFTSIPDMAGQVFPIPGIGALVRTRFDNASKIATMVGPLLLVHGDRDEIVPYSMGQRLAHLAGDRGELVTIPGGTHNDTWLVGGIPYFQALARYVDRVSGSG